MCLQSAVEIYVDMGRFQNCGKHTMEMAELYEDDLKIDEAIEHYQMASDYYETADSSAQVSKCLLKVAQFQAEKEQYNEAAEIYKRLGIEALENNLLKYGAKDHFLHAGLCLLANGDETEARSALEMFKNSDPSFEATREGKLLEAIIDAFAENDVTGFTNIVFEYDNISKLSAWMTTILLRIKGAMKEAEVGDIT
eukprot:TRINITY_DN1386_c0_g1_i5.p1 TRINITY_DN1386_c0_g1~~TRINITY_DN1386_c0_g1_i5.p1  ORF type:complete len:196 (-),score=59.06 TRINITY_DN1386_c0_g1_i5:339-926(-)